MRKQTLIGLVASLIVIIATIHFLYGVKPARGSSVANRTAEGAVVTGTVINLEGHRIAGADVFAVSSRGSVGRRPHSLTDSDGNFTIGGLKAGTYFMEAQKFDEGYASNRQSFASAGLAEVPQIVLGENEVVTDIVLRFGPKSARLIGQIIDIKTRNGIRNAQIILRRADNPDHFYSTGPNDPKVWNRFNLLVPPRPFTVEVKAPGYQDWTYSNDGSGKHKDTLQLHSGQRKELTIALQKKSDSP